MEENRRIPPRPIPPRPPMPQNMDNKGVPQGYQNSNINTQTNDITQTIDKKSKPKREPLSEQTKNALFYCGCAISFALAVVCLVLVFVL